MAFNLRGILTCTELQLFFTNLNDNVSSCQLTPQLQQTFHFVCLEGSHGLCSYLMPAGQNDNVSQKLEWSFLRCFTVSSHYTMATGMPPSSGNVVALLSRIQEVVFFYRDIIATWSSLNIRWNPPSWTSWVTHVNHFVFCLCSEPP